MLILLALFAACQPVGASGSRTILAMLPPGTEHTCAPAPAGWEHHRLFVDSSPAQARWGAPRPDRLARYCRYTTPSAATPGDAATVRAANPAAVVAIDHTEPVPSGLDDPRIDRALMAAFSDAIDAVSPDAVADTRAPVAVAVLDTVPAGVQRSGIPAAQRHGSVVGALIRSIACPRQHDACRDRVRNAVAMPRRPDGVVDWEGGGIAGSALDVADALVATVGRWRSQRGASPRLVVNLSLGWPPTEAAPVSAAVEDALRFAACSGALVVAAAGNQSRSAPEGRGPLSPARYQAQPAPGAEQCAALGFSPPERHLPLFDGAARPLVLAVGGVDGFDRLIQNARPQSTPPLVAYAHRTLDEAGGTPLSGTSISSAVVSGQAALLWAHKPALTPAALIARIYDSGYPTGATADVALETATSVVRVSVCASLATIRDGLSCVAQPAPEDGHLAEVEQAVQQTLYGDPNRRVFRPATQ